MSKYYTILRSDCSSSVATPAELVGPELPCDLIHFLAVAQTLGVDVLALTWQPALGLMGRGGTSDIQELLVKLHTSFAFKKLEYLENARIGEREIYQALISEITILGQESLRTHPNIKPLLGACWDMRLNGRVWPVLVSERSSLGNLDQFMESTEGRSLSFAARLKICNGVALAIRDMHNCHIVHGDINPSNILIDSDDSTEYVSKVVDFGYATLYTGQGRIITPFTPGWSAPSTRGGETFLQAKARDAFSFGLLCLWLLFHIAPRPKGFEFRAATPQTLVATAQNLVETEKALDESQKQDYRMLFSLTLSLEAERRIGDFNEILKHLSYSRMQNSKPVESVITKKISKPYTFSLTRMAGQLYMGDIRVRAHVLKVLEEVVVTSVDSDRQRQCAFEAAICYAIGFGVPKDIQQSQRLLAQSGRLDLDLKRELEMLKTTPTSYRNSTIAAYHAEGTIFSPYISLLAEPRSVVNRIAQECKRELRDLEPYLGTQDSLFQHLQREYASLLLQLELHEEAERVWHDIVNTSKALFGPHNPTTITDMGNLAHTLGIQSKCDQAEKILTEALALSIMAPDLGPEHQVTLARRNELAFLMCQSGNYASAKKLHQEVLAARKRTLGDRHPEVLESRRGLLSAFDGLGESTGVVSQLEEVLDFHLRTLGPTHSETIKTRFQLAEALLASGAIERAEKETWMVLDLGAKYLDDHNITILHCRDVRAQVLLRLGHAEAAELLAEETLRLTRVSQGQMSNSTIIALDGLAQILAARGNLVAAEVHQREAVSYIKQSEQAESYNGLLFKHNLALTMDRLERYEEAEEFYREAYEGRLKKWGSAYPETMESKRCLLRVLELQGKQLEK